MGAKPALALLIVATTLARLILAGSVGPSNDESYYQLYAAHPDWSFFDHPPMLGWLQGPGMRLLGADSWLGPRLAFVLLSAGSTWLVARLAARPFGAWAGLWAALCLNAIPYHGLAAGTFALPDGPLLFFWLLTLDRLIVACERDNLGAWAAVGLAWGGANLSKYHALLLPPIVLATLLWHAPWRRLLRRPGPHLALALGTLMFLPVIFWNYQHDWVSFRFQGGRATPWTGPRLDLFVRSVAGQSLYLTPWLGALLAITLVRGWRARRDASGPERLLLVAASAPLGLIALVSLFREVLPHWSLIGSVSLLPALGRDRIQALGSRPTRLAWRGLVLLGAPLVLGMMLIGQYHHGWFQRGAPGRLGLLTAQADPTAEGYGWDQVVARLEAGGWLDRPNTFVFAGNWYHAGHLARALRGRAQVLCYSVRDPRGFAFWTEPGPWVGRDGVLVTVGENIVEPRCFDRWFHRVEPVDSFWVERAGGRLVPVRVAHCQAQRRPFPFTGPERLAFLQRQRR